MFQSLCWKISYITRPKSEMVEIIHLLCSLLVRKLYPCPAIAHFKTLACNMVICMCPREKRQGDIAGFCQKNQSFQFLGESNRVNSPFSFILGRTPLCVVVIIILYRTFSRGKGKDKKLSLPALLNANKYNI